MSTWYTSDQHWDHKNIIEYSKRPFLNVEHMQESMVFRHNQVVSATDVVYHLGDFCFDERRVAEFLKPLTGRHILIAGNHDKCHPCHKKHEKALKIYLSAGFEQVHVNTLEMPAWTLCHMPYLGDGVKEERYVQYRPQDKGAWLLHGHVHEQWKTKGKMINVGVDQWDFYPVHEETLIDILKEHRT